MPVIVKKGPETFTATCRRCGCMFSYKIEELKRYSKYGQGTVDCPQCGNEHEHPDQRRAT
jgi:transcription elongation factor Elf1